MTSSWENLLQTMVSRGGQFGLGFFTATFLFLGMLSFSGNIFSSEIRVVNLRPVSWEVREDPTKTENVQLKIHEANATTSIIRPNNKYSGGKKQAGQRKEVQLKRKMGLVPPGSKRVSARTERLNKESNDEDLKRLDELNKKADEYLRNIELKKEKIESKLSSPPDDLVPGGTNQRRRNAMSRKLSQRQGRNRNALGNKRRQKNQMTQEYPVDFPQSKSTAWKEKPKHVTDSEIWNQMVKYFPDIIRRFRQPLLPGYKNPCFKEAGRIRCLPYFYLGGAPKCGTTDFWFNLQRHPDVFSRVSKEPHFWKERTTNSRGTAFYLNHFNRFTQSLRSNPSKRSKYIAGDGSASTLWANYGIVEKTGIETKGEIPFVFADVIHALQPKVKIIFILRNPTDRTISEYFAFSKKKSPEDFHKKVESHIVQFRSCLQSRSLKTCANVHRDTSPRVQIGVYVAHLREWLRVFPREQILILTTEEWHVHEETNLMQDVYKFLDIENIPDEKLSPIKDFALKDINRKQKTKKGYNTYGEIFPKTRKMLDTFYASYNKQLAAFLKDDRFLAWK